MVTRRHGVQPLPAFAVTAFVTLDSVDANPAFAAPALPAEGHFHPNGNVRSVFSEDVLRKARKSLPFGDNDRCNRTSI